MTVRQKSHNRCERCFMRRALCVCPLIPTIPLSTRVTILMHRVEATKTTNTGRLAALVLPNSEIRVRGIRGRPMSTENLLPEGFQTLLLYPSEDALELTPERAAEFRRPLHLVVADGNWGQARKIASREPVLKDVPRVKLPSGAPSGYFLRTTPHPENLSTFEAIARALGALEGAHVRETMEALFDTVVERTLWSRGLKAREECRTVIPEAAVQEFFTAGCRGLPRQSRSR